MTAIRHSFRGFWIPYGLFEHPSLGMREKFLITEIRYLDHGEGCYASNAYLADILKVSEQTIANMISTLKKEGWIVTKKYDGRNRWLSINPVKWQQVESVVEEEYSPLDTDPMSPSSVKQDYRFQDPKIQESVEQSYQNCESSLTESGKSDLLKKVNTLPNMVTDLPKKVTPLTEKSNEDCRNNEPKSIEINSDEENNFSLENIVEKEIVDRLDNTPPIVPPTGGEGRGKSNSSSNSKNKETAKAIERELFGSEADPIGLYDEPAIGIWQLWIPSRRGTTAEVRKAYKQVRKPDNVAAIRAGVEEFMRSLYVTSRIETGNAGFIKHLATWLRARGWEEAGTGAWDEPCQEWKRLHASEQPGFNYNGPCRVINFAPRDGTLG